MPSNQTYDTVSFPIAFKNDVYQIIPVDWDSGNLSKARGYTFMILSANVTLTNTNIVTDQSVGFYKVLIIGVQTVGKWGTKWDIYRVDATISKK